MSDRSSGAVSWQDVSPVGEWPEFFADAGEQLFVVPVRKIGPADPAAEEDIAADDEILSREVETETVRRMSRDVEQGKRQVTELQCIFPGEEMLDRVGGNGAGDSHHLLESLGESQVVGWLCIRIERAIKGLPKEPCIEDMIVMLVRQDDGIGPYSDLLEPGGHTLGCVEEPTFPVTLKEEGIGLKNAATILIDTDFCHDDRLFP